MRPAANLCRRALLGGFIALVLISAAPAAWAQDPRSALVQKTARDWLAMADGEDGGASWKAAGKQFKNAMSSVQWSQALVQVHLPMGKTLQRTMIGTSFDQSFPGAPNGDYATIEFRTAFEGKSDAGETVTLEREADGVWRVIGYSIH